MTSISLVIENLLSEDGGWGGGDFHMKETETLDVSLRGVNYGCAEVRK